MDPKELRKRLSSGVIAFPVTPFKPDLSLDLEGVRKNLRLLLSHPLSAIVAPAGTGEVFALSPSEHMQVLQTTLDETGGKVPVLTALPANTAIASDIAAQSIKAGVNGFLLFPPYYPHADEAGLVDYYASIAKKTSLGVIVYSRDWVNPSASTVEKLADQAPNLIAWKDGTGDLRKYQQIMQRLGDRLAWIGGVGDDQVPGYFSIGVRTYTSSIAVVSPKLSLELYERAAGNDYATLRKLMNEFVIPLYAFRQRKRGYEVSVMKEMMMQIGLAGGPVRPPLLNLTQDEVREVTAMVKQWKDWL
ncbi:MAG TPA: 5-dehydro-4-deoxyglucarate dehydratase [Polyangiaceae bacterium]|nr:5-dehydro-4-deoxyglucarate dehydratase [Polyangiaceae bacterium]